MTPTETKLTGNGELFAPHGSKIDVKVDATVSTQFFPISGVGTSGVIVQTDEEISGTLTAPSDLNPFSLSKLSTIGRAFTITLSHIATDGKSADFTGEN